MQRQIIDPNDIPAILDLRRQGNSHLRIAVRYGCSASYIKKICLENGVNNKLVSYTPYWNDNRKQALAQMWRDGASFEEMCSAFDNKSKNCIATMISVLRSEGWNVPRRDTHPRYTRKPGVSFSPQ